MSKSDDRDPAELLALFDPLDKTTPKITAPKVSLRQRNKSIKHPEYAKWLNYPRNRIIPYTISPANDSIYKTGKTWRQLNTLKEKKNRITKVIRSFFKDCIDNDIIPFKDIFICWELGSNNGRFHCHGLIYLGEATGLTLRYFIEKINKGLGSKRYDYTWKGQIMKSNKDEDFKKCYNYVTKDIDHMYLSLFRMKWTPYSTIVKKHMRVDIAALESGVKY